MTPAALWHFDARRFGRELRARRKQAGYSTRRLARSAGVSQAYVVALEGSRSSRDPSGPCPTVEVLVGFATALQADPTELLRTSLLSAGPHVLLVTAGHGADNVDTAREQARDVDVWVSAGQHRPAQEVAAHIDLHPGGESGYQPDGVAAAIREGLARLRPQIEGRQVGLVFSEAESTLLESTEAVLAVEHEWQAIVSRAAWSAGASPAVTVCTYEISSLQAMSDPVTAGLDLVASHDTVWAADGRETRRGRSASLRVLEQLRPPTTGVSAWRRICRDHLDRLSAA